MSTTKTKEHIVICHPKVSRFHPGYWYFYTKDPNHPSGKDKTISCREDQIDWVEERLRTQEPIIEGEHAEFRANHNRDDDVQSGTFLMEHIGHTTRRRTSGPAKRMASTDFKADDMPLDEEPPATWNINRDPGLIKAEGFAREIAYVTEMLIEEYPSLDQESRRTIAITAFIQANKM